MKHKCIIRAWYTNSVRVECTCGFTEVISSLPPSNISVISKIGPVKKFTGSNADLAVQRHLDWAKKRGEEILP